MQIKLKFGFVFFISDLFLLFAGCLQLLPRIEKQESEIG